MLRQASEHSIRDSAGNAMRVAQEHQFQPIAFPLIGAGSSGFNLDQAKTIILDELKRIQMQVKIVVFRMSG